MPQRSTWTSWSATDEPLDGGAPARPNPPAPPAARQPAAPPPAAPPRAPAPPQQQRPAPPPAPRAPAQHGMAPQHPPQQHHHQQHSMAPPPHLSNSAVLAELARQARASRNDLQQAQELFARRAQAMLENLRVVDTSLVELATHVLGNPVLAAVWFSSRNLHLGQRAPLEMLAVGERDHVVGELMRLEHGAY